jgi:outer membrane protein assembly factor BamB
MNETSRPDSGSNSAEAGGWREAEGQDPGQRRRECDGMVANLPEWAQDDPRGRRWFTRRRLIRTGAVVVVLFFLAWLYYPFFPNPIKLLFNSPSTKLSSASLPGQWSMVGRDLQLTRHVPTVAAQPEGRVVWSHDLGTPTRAAPIVHDGVVYIGGFFKISALDAATGEQLWEVTVPSPLDHSMALAGDLLYVGLTDHRIIALDRNTQQFRWTVKTGGQIASSPIVAEGIVYVGSGDNALNALDAASGDVLWQGDIVGEVRAAPAVSDGLVYATDNLGNLYVFDARTGQSKLRFRTEGNTKASPVIANGLAYFTSGGQVHAVDADAREIAGEYQFKLVWKQFWDWKVPGVPRPAAQKGKMWLFDPDFAFDRATGSWSTTGVVATPSVASDSLYVGSFKGGFYKADAIAGTETWRFEADGAIFGSPVVVGDQVHFGTEAGSFYALDRRDGGVIWKLPLGAPVEISPVFAGGRLYVRTNDGALHAIE